ncbi:MAG: dihydrolipoyl dehydrogenase [Nitrospina sp.]|jgi:dihydrolipoamide dehydrogenase|nr:dihydrolipoyl dehydrogenase [Nitrospina sp.]
MLDTVIIGGGTGGYVSAIRISQHGGNVILVERDKMGGLCLNRGCIPTKFLVQNTRQLAAVKKNPVISGDVSIDYEKLVSRKNQVTGMLCKGLEMLMGSHGVKIIKGTAIPESPNVIRVLHSDGKEEKLETKNLIIATGSEPISVPGISPDGIRILTSDDILAMSSLPANLLILGGGYIGVEFASIFSSLGCKVTIVEEMPDILQGIDQDLGKMIKALLIKGRVEVLTGSSIRNVVADESGLNVQIETPAGMKEVSVEKMLLAAGRKAFIDSSCKVLGIDFDDNKIQVNAKMETNVPGIYAVGDVIGPPLLAHVAMAEAEVAADNIMGKERTMDYSKIPACIFTTPEAASIGMSEQEASRDHEIKIGKFQFRNNSRAILSNEIEGFVKVIVDKTSRALLGVHIIGPNAAELIAAASVLLKSEGTVEDLAEAIQAHPTLAESLTEAALDVDGLGIHIPKMP